MHGGVETELRTLVCRLAIRRCLGAVCMSLRAQLYKRKQRGLRHPVCLLMCAADEC